MNQYSDFLSFLLWFKASTYFLFYPSSLSLILYANHRQIETMECYLEHLDLNRYKKIPSYLCRYYVLTNGVFDYRYPKLYLYILHLYKY